MAYSDDVLADNPIGYWKANDTGSTAADSSGNGRTLNYTLGSGVSITKSQSSLVTNLPNDTSVKFVAGAGSSPARASKGDLATMSFPNGGSIEAWVKINTLPSTSTNFAAFGTGLAGFPTASTMAIGVNSTGQLRLTVNNSATSVTGAFLSAGTVYHIVFSVSISGSTRVRQAYINGSQVFNVSDSTITFPDATTIAFGAAGNLFDITVDDVSIYNYALTSTDVSDHYNSGITSPNSAPANTAAPSISGTAKVGQTLTTTDGTWTGTPTPTYAYKWQVSDNGSTGWSDISGATSSTFTITSSQSGKYIRSQVTATNVAGSATALSSATTQIVENPTVSTPTISGTAKVGQVLTASASATAGFPSPSLSYQWQVADTSGGSYSNISGATSSTFTITSSQSGKYIRSQVTATNSEGSASEVSAATTQIATGIPTEGTIWHTSRTNMTTPTEGLIWWTDPKD